MARMQYSHPKRPRQYAAEIAAAPRADRARLIARIPERFRAWVRHYLDDWKSRAVLAQAAVIGREAAQP